MPFQRFLLLCLADPPQSPDAHAQAAGAPGHYLRCLDAAGRWAVQGAARSPLLVWKTDDADAAQQAADEAAAAHGRAVRTVPIGRSDWVEGRNCVVYGSAHAAALRGPLAQSSAKARRLRTEADKLEAFAAVVLAAAAATDRASYDAVRQAAAQSLRARFGGGSIPAACAWLAGKEGRAALDSVLDGEVELAHPHRLAEIVEAVRVAGESEGLHAKP